MILLYYRKGVDKMVLVNRTTKSEVYPESVTFNGMVGKLTKRGEGQDRVAFAMVIDETGPGYDD
jgi:hypothetical protein